MTNPKSPPQPAVSVEQSDAAFIRDLAGRMFRTATPAMGFDQGDTDRLHLIAHRLSAAAPADGVPAGFVLVPCVPTEAMAKAAWKCTLGGTVLMAERAYLAALAAAPKAPTAIASAEGGEK